MIKILATGDLHLGKNPNPSHHGEETADHITTNAMWKSIIDYACIEKVAALLLAGDIVNASKGFFPVIGPLEAGIKRLAEQGIPVYAVAGNHDVALLTRLSDVLKLDSFIILGKNGEWERKPLNMGNAELDIWGKSFTSERAEHNPARSFPKSKLRQGVPAIGLLHCDIGNSGPYAPVKRDDLIGCGISNWVLGHIHLPGDVFSQSAAKNIFYTGSPLPLDPSEQGHHGPCLLEFDNGGKLSGVTRIPMSPLRYDVLTVDVNDAATIDDIQLAVADEARKKADEAYSGNPALTHLALRVKLGGRTRLKEDETCNQIKRNLDQDGSASLHEHVRIFVEHVEATFAPQVELESYRGSPKPLGVAADLIAALDGDTQLSEEMDAILNKLVEDIADRNSSSYFGLDAESLPDRKAIGKIAEEQLLKIAHTIFDQSEGKA